MNCRLFLWTDCRLAEGENEPGEGKPGPGRVLHSEHGQSQPQTFHQVQGETSRPQKMSEESRQPRVIHTENFLSYVMYISVFFLAEVTVS